MTIRKRFIFTFLKLHHELYDEFVLLALFRNAIGLIEVFFVVDSDVRLKRFAETECDSSCKTLARIICRGESSVGKFHSVAVVSHEIIAAEE